MRNKGKRIRKTKNNKKEIVKYKTGICIKIRDSPHKGGQIRIYMCNYGERSDVPYLNIKKQLRMGTFLHKTKILFNTKKKKVTTKTFKL